jgi:Zn-finger nucleic acid-binding protein
MTCPKCQGSMRGVHYEEIAVDRCTRCGGLWFDLLEHQDLKERPGSERIDSAPGSQTRKLDEQAKVMCPVDGVRMVRMVDAGQPHIWLESCPVCHGTFFDAGEFSDWQERTLTEFLRRKVRKRDM